MALLRKVFGVKISFRTALQSEEADFTLLKDMRDHSIIEEIKSVL